MELFGWIAAIAGNVLFIGSLVLTVRANPGSRIPFNRNPPVIPPGSIAMRSIGAGLLVFGAVGLSSTFSYWGVLIVFAGVLVAMVVIPIHNSRLPQSPS
jgi:hypothetical protein